MTDSLECIRDEALFMEWRYFARILLEGQRKTEKPQDSNVGSVLL
jgi:hypothetical protein